MKKCFLTAMVLGITTFGSAILAREAIVTKVAFCDMQQLMAYGSPEMIKQAPEEWQKELGKLQAEVTKRAQKIQKMSQDLEKMADEAKKKKGMTSDDAREKQNIEMMELQQKIEIQAKALEAYQQQEFNKVGMAFQQKVAKKVKEIKEMQGWNMVVPIALFADESCDITKDVVNSLNSDYKKATVKPVALKA